MDRDGSVAWKGKGHGLPHGTRGLPTEAVCVGYRRNVPILPRPGPEPSRGTFAWASATLSVRPSISRPFILVIAPAASSWVESSRKPKPLLWPESLSVTMLTDSTVPNCKNASFRESSVAENGRFPTYSLLPISPPSRRQSRKRGHEHDFSGSLKPRKFTPNWSLPHNDEENPITGLFAAPASSHQR